MTEPATVASVEALVARVLADPDALLTEEVIDLGCKLSRADEVAFARLRQQFREHKVMGSSVAEFLRLVKVRLARAAAAERRGPSFQGTWRDRLRPDRMTGLPRASPYNLKLILEHTYKDRLAFDEMAAVPILDGKPFTDAMLAKIRCDLEEDEDLEFNRSDIWDAIVVVGQMNAFHPVRRYLASLEWDGVARINKVASEFFGAEDKLSAKLTARFFISAVARAMQPGCKVDNVLVLCGDEYMKKSTFFRVLGGPWFKDSKVDITDRKGVMVMHSAWIYELPEIDRMLEAKHDSDVKAYVTQQEDSLIPMYGRVVMHLPRSNVPAGTTNKEKFILSDTGSRRWWVVHVRKRIDAERLEADRDQLWAEAFVLYQQYLEHQKNHETSGDRNPYRWWLTPEEEQRREERNEDHLTPSPDMESVEAWLSGAPVTCPNCMGTGSGTGRTPIGEPHPCTLCNAAKSIVRGELAKTPEGREYVTLAMVLTWALGVPLERHERDKGRATRTLRRLGWRSGKRIRPAGASGPRITPYYAPADPAEEGERAAIEGKPPPS